MNVNVKYKLLFVCIKILKISNRIFGQSSDVPSGMVIILFTICVICIFFNFCDFSTYLSWFIFVLYSNNSCPPAASPS